MSPLTRRAALATAAGLGLRWPGHAQAGKAAPGLLPVDPIPKEPARARPVPYGDPDVLSRMPFGTHSHWLQPWRAATGTVPAAALRGVGIALGAVALPMPPGAMCAIARSGIRTVRITIPWGEVDYATESRFQHEAGIRKQLLACREWGLRPLILLDGHHGHPCPALFAEGRAAETARVGTRWVEVITGDAEIVPRRTGLCDLTDYRRPELFVTAVQRAPGWQAATRLRLSKPLPVTLTAGARILLTTLRYEPFSVPGSTGNAATLAGWLRFVDLVARFAAEVLRPSDVRDRGFDLEIWNELTLGSDFLSLNNYYAPPPLSYNPDSIWDEIIERTASHIAPRPDLYAGVGLSNGFANTVPWPAAPRMPPRVTAISKHPYPELRTFPRDEKDTVALGADAQPTRFVPSYTAFFPEQFATGLQTDTVLRDVGNAPNTVNGVLHGRLTRATEAGTPRPVDVWMTEIGFDPADMGAVGAGTAEHWRAKFCLRTAIFYIGIGAARIYLFVAWGDPPTFVLLPKDGGGGALNALARALAAIRGPDGAAAATPLRQLGFEVFPDPDAGIVFAGGATPSTPPLLVTDCLVLLPFQASPGRLVVAYYVMTRDIRQDMAPVAVRIRATGLAARGIRATAYDPMTDREVHCAVEAQAPEGTVLRLLAADVPRLLVLQEDTG